MYPDGSVKDSSFDLPENFQTSPELASSLAGAAFAGVGAGFRWLLLSVFCRRRWLLLLAGRSSCCRCWCCAPRQALLSGAAGVSLVGAAGFVDLAWRCWSCWVLTGVAVQLLPSPEKEDKKR
ncbi:hypothetical protein AABB24_000585 [Solanum stoloniferum]|uniref:Transmembrane protein n=1 Tax=Solanum stoloniferum TaxID=62892 RepID=A0ABD2VIV5_9SOLN